MMNNKTFFLILILIYNSLFFFGQDNSSSINNSDRSIKVWRTTENIEEVIAFPVNSFSVSQNTEKYIYMMVNYEAQPDIAIAVDAADENSDGNFDDIIRPIEPYTNFGEWQTLVFPISGGANGIDVNALLIYPDLGLQNESTEQILNDSGSFGYIDEIVLRDTNTLATENLTKDNTFIYPNPFDKTFKISSTNTIVKIALYNSLGKQVNNLLETNTNEYNIDNLSKGLYFIKLTDDTGLVQIKKLIKK